MSQALTTPLLRATTATFENFALLPSEVVTGWSDAGPTATSWVEFVGSGSGRLELVVSRALLPLITSTMMGVENANDSALQEDALGELANVICGNILADLDALQIDTRIAPPSTESVEAPDHEPVTRACIRLDDGMAEARLYLRPA